MSYRKNDTPPVNAVCTSRNRAAPTDAPQNASPGEKLPQCAHWGRRGIRAEILRFHPCFSPVQILSTRRSSSVFGFIALPWVNETKSTFPPGEGLGAAAPERLCKDRPPDGPCGPKGSPQGEPWRCRTCVGTGVPDGPDQSRPGRHTQPR